MCMRLAENERHISESHPQDLAALVFKEMLMVYHILGMELTYVKDGCANGCSFRRVRGFIEWVEDFKYAFGERVSHNS
jgi:hypothetical protein